jgi:hypothetical protein
MFIDAALPSIVDAALVSGTIGVGVKVDERGAV